MSFGLRLREKREAKKLSQTQLGKGLGTNGKDATKAVVNGWEKGRHFPRVDQLALICGRLDCSADYLVLGKEPVALELSPEAARVAADIDTFQDAEQREWVLGMCRHSIQVVRKDGLRAASQSRFGNA
jgi:transcriptional regulator with XRE-family HTH domain